jgi:hypothetical protein
MFDFLFKRSASKSPAPRAVMAQQAAAATALNAARRSEQAARAQATFGDETAAAAFILESEFADARLIAAEHIHSQPVLEKIHQAMRNTDRRVAKLMQTRLERIRHEQAEQQKAQASLDTAQRLLDDDKLSPNQVAELDRQWQVIQASLELAARFDTLRAGLARRLEAQVLQQRAVIDAVAALRALPEAGLDQERAAQAVQRLADEHAAHLAGPEHASLPKQLLADFAEARAQAEAALRAQAQNQVALDARQAALADWQAAEPAQLNPDAIKRAWQALPRMLENAAGAALQQQFEAVLAAIPVASKPKRERAASAAAPEDGGQAFLAALDGMEAALQQGLLQQASEHDKTLRECKGARLTPAQSERLANVRAEFKRLADWARWGGNVSREELVKSAEELPTQELPMLELAKKVGSLRERWKSLDTLSGSAPKALWERFDAACSTAYAPAAAHFRQLAEERHGNAVKAQELIDETLALAQAGGSDWKQLAATLQRLRQSWSRLGTIDRKDRKRLDGAFDQALALLGAPLAQQRQIETARREQLIAEVRLLQPNERSTVDMLRALQEKWQELAKALPLERRAEQALWQNFRAACDDVFAKRKEFAHAADDERRAHLQAREALCAQLETAVIPAGDDKQQAAALAALLREAAQAWRACGPVPRAQEQKIEQRYADAVAALRQQADAIARRADAAQVDALRDKLRLCQELESSLSASGAGRDDVQWSALWSELAPLDAHYERTLQARFAVARQALAEPGSSYVTLLELNRASLKEEVLRLEILAGVDSGAEFARERLKLQVEVLQSSLQAGRKDLTAASQLLELCALPALADERTAARIDVLLRHIAGGEAR